MDASWRNAGAGGSARSKDATSKARSPVRSILVPGRDARSFLTLGSFSRGYSGDGGGEVSAIRGRTPSVHRFWGGLAQEMGYRYVNVTVCGFFSQRSGRAGIFLGLGTHVLINII